MPQVYLGRDTRDSSPMLAAAVMKGISALGVQYIDYGEVTTPQLHYLVANHEDSPKAADYIENFSTAFNSFCELAGPAKEGYEPNICVDCANGVGYEVFKKFIPKIIAYV